MKIDPFSFIWNVWASIDNGNFDFNQWFYGVFFAVNSKSKNASNDKVSKYNWNFKCSKYNERNEITLEKCWYETAWWSFSLVRIVFRNVSNFCSFILLIAQWNKLIETFHNRNYAHTLSLALSITDWAETLATKLNTYVIFKKKGWRDWTQNYHKLYLMTRASQMFVWWTVLSSKKQYSNQYQS